MIEFLTDYGLFLAKTVTLVLAFVIAMGAMMGMSMRQKNEQDRGQLQIVSLNDEFLDMKHMLEEAVMDKAELKQVKKEEKREAKAKKKQLAASTEERRRVYVLDFDGDIEASAVREFRQVVSAVLQLATPNDEILLRLESPGGQVHGYGLAASQLVRIRERNIPLTVAVDKVAASGGYLMACVADRIISAPFAVIGSIGVVAQLPNFHRLLQKNDVDIEMHTAGKYKRTLTMLGENTDEGREKFQQELEETHTLFKEFVSDYRPRLDIEALATGEHWYGAQAVKTKLVDELKTSDDYLLEKSADADLYEVSFEYKKSFGDQIGIFMQATMARLSGVGRRSAKMGEM